MLKDKQELTEWATEHFTKYSIRQPNTYTQQELKDLNPEVPSKRNIQMLDEDDGYHD